MHPCTYCREHFLSSVSKNDIFWRDVEKVHNVKKIQAYRYPLEWLFIMKKDYNKNVLDLNTKLDISIQSGRDLVLFFLKIT